MTLRELRLNAGLSEAQLAEKVSAITGIRRGHRAVVMWEFRGIEDLRTIRAIAQALGLEEDEVSIAAKESAQGGGPKFRRGRPKKIISPVV